MFQYLLASLLFLVTLTYIRFFSNQNKNFPPGPGLPTLIRNAIQIANFPYNKFIEWANIYGPVMRLKVGSDEIIVLSDFEIIKNLFADPLTSGRISNNHVFYETSLGPYGVFNSEGETWDTQRKFTIKTLREYGFGKSSMEDKIMTEVNVTIEWFRKNVGNAISGNNLFEKFIVNILWNIASSQRCDMDTAEQDPTSAVYKMKEFTLALQQITENGLFFFPFMRHIFPERMGWTRYVNANNELTKHFLQTIAEHKETWNPSEYRDFMDHILKEMDEAKNPQSSFFGEDGQKNARALLFDMLVGGAITTTMIGQFDRSASLSWFLLYISHNPQFQKKVHQEIDQVLGSSQSPTLNHKSKMPVTEALVMEVLRCSSVAAFGVPRKALADIKCKGYHISKNSGIIANLYGVHQSPNIWGDPENFRPERFLSEDGTQIVRREELIPFGEGKRKCIGDKLAKDEMFLYVSALIQAFVILPEKVGEKCDFESVKGSFVRSPKPFKIIFKLR